MTDEQRAELIALIEQIDDLLSGVSPQDSNEHEAFLCFGNFRDYILGDE